LHLRPLSQSSIDILALQVEVTWVQEVVADAKAIPTTTVSPPRYLGCSGRGRGAGAGIQSEGENSTALASTHEDTKVLAWKVALLENKLAVERRAW
jgi:hypothetical protein